AAVAQRAVAHHLRVRHERADRDPAVLAPDLAQVADPANVDQHLGLCQAQLHDRDQAVAAGQDLGAVAELVEQLDRLVDARRRLVLECGGDHRAPPWMMRQTFSAVIGISTSLTPRCASASTTALTTAGVEPIVPASPTPLAPIGLTGEGVSVWSSSNV